MPKMWGYFFIQNTMCTLHCTMLSNLHNILCLLLTMYLSVPIKLRTTPWLNQGGSAIKIYETGKFSDFEEVAWFFEIRNIISWKLSFGEQNGAQFVITGLWFPHLAILFHIFLLITELLITDYQLQNYQILITYLPMSFALPLALPNNWFNELLNY